MRRRNQSQLTSTLSLINSQTARCPVQPAHCPRCPTEGRQVLAVLPVGLRPLGERFSPESDGWEEALDLRRLHNTQKHLTVRCHTSPLAADEESKLYQPFCPARSSPRKARRIQFPQGTASMGAQSRTSAVRCNGFSSISLSRTTVSAVVHILEIDNRWSVEPSVSNVTSCLQIALVRRA